MPLKTKTIKVGEHDVNIIQFNALETLKLRKELVGILKKEIGDISVDNTTAILKSLATLLYEVPAEFLLKLFKNCTAIEIGELASQSNFNQVFESNVDGVIELASGVLEFNAFFSLNAILNLTKKIPMLKPLEEGIQQALKSKRGV